MVERNTSDIKELKEQQHEFKGVIESSLSSIKTSLEQMNVNLKLLTQRLDYVEQGKLK